jgi:ABC-type phosphonate transport system ATPase subunit
MRFVHGLVFLSQTSAVDSLSTTTWPGLILAILGGGTGVAVLHKIIAEHLREKREDARRQADEEKLRRDAKNKAEVEQIEALTAMARGVPAEFAAMGARFERIAIEQRTSNELTREFLAAHTRSVDALREEMASESRGIMKAMAVKLGVQTTADETNSSRRASNPGQPHA